MKTFAAFQQLKELRILFWSVYIFSGIILLIECGLWGMHFFAGGVLDEVYDPERMGGFITFLFFYSFLCVLPFTLISVFRLSRKLSIWDVTCLLVGGLYLCILWSIRDELNGI